MTPSPPPRELLHFLLLNRDAQATAVRRMAMLGWTDYGIAAATRLSVEQVRRALAAGSTPNPAESLDAHP